MSPPYLLRADPSWDVIDLALLQRQQSSSSSSTSSASTSTTAARAALRHAKKRYEDVLVQLQELLEYYHHHNLPLPPTYQHQQQQHNSSTIVRSRSSNNNTITNQNRLRNQYFNNSNSQQHQQRRASSYNSSSSAAAMTEYFTRSEFNPVPRGVTMTRRTADSRDPQPTTRLRCGTSSFVNRDHDQNANNNNNNNNNNITSVSPISQNTITTSIREQEAIQRLLDTARSISSQRVGRSPQPQYFYHGTPVSNNNNNNNRSVSTTTTTTQKKEGTSGRKTITITEIVVDDVEQEEDVEEEEKWTHEDDFTQGEKPPRSDSASPLPYQRRPRHHNHYNHHNHDNDNNFSPLPRRQGNNESSLSPSAKRSRHRHQEHANDEYNEPIQSNETHLQRGFSLAKRTSSFSPSNRRYQQPSSLSKSPSIRRCGYRGVGDVDPEQEKKILEKIEKRKEQLSLIKNRKSSSTLETLLVFSLAGCIAYGAVKYGLVEL